MSIFSFRNYFEQLIGVPIKDGEHGESKTGIIHKLTVGLMETDESEYCLELLSQAGIFEFLNALKNLYELLRLYVS